MTKNNAKKPTERINMYLPPDLAKRLDKYCLSVANKRGKIPHDLKTKIGRKAFTEWLDKHENDFNIKL